MLTPPDVICPEPVDGAPVDEPPLDDDDPAPVVEEPDDPAGVGEGDDEFAPGGEAVALRDGLALGDALRLWCGLAPRGRSDLNPGASRNAGLSPGRSCDRAGELPHTLAPASTPVPRIGSRRRTVVHTRCTF
jgi:hypothetical protein